ncbi:hypothetical protein BKA70DRAFT_1452214 [Coprinopsis sp. MPI-PUGE-AT-0042]|nr:hypothetical protein BKA70DRAFT_1452214 [Coprinopsis sp. MPI-PUGE-AT-0042]
MTNSNTSEFASINAYGEVEWYVDHIVAETTHGANKEYRVRWRGYDDNTDTWESADTMKACEALQLWKEQMRVLSAVREYREWEVDRIVQQYIDDTRCITYRVRWRWCEDDEDTWERVASLRGCHALEVWGHQISVLLEVKINPVSHPGHWCCE